MTKAQEEEAGSYSMNEDDANNDYICSNNDHSIGDDDNMKQGWGTWEELLLACAVKRHGFSDWDSVSTEVRSRTSSVSAVLFSADNCRHKYQDLKRRFKEPTVAAEAAAATATAAGAEGGGDNINIPWLEELRSLRVAELRREVEQYDVSILSLQRKVKKLEEERDGGEKVDLEKGERCEKAEESDRENRSMNESNSTGSGEKTVGEDGRVGGDEPSQTRNADPDPEAEEGSEGSLSGELGESGTSGRKWRRKRRKDSDGEIRSAASKSQPLIRLLDLIRSHPRGSLFERRVRIQETEDYKSFVKQRLDIETIQRKLKQGSYDSSRLTFYRDLQLLFTNVITFFPSSSSESMAAHELKAIVSEEIRKESGKSSPPRVLKASAGIKSDAAETSEQKSSAPLVACKRRRFVSAKAKASPTSSSFGLKEETKEETVSEDNENVETGGRSSKRTANNTKTGKGKNKQNQAETEAKTEKKVVVSSDKKKSVADFLKRIKKSSPQKEERDQNKSGGNGKKESKPKPRELRSNNVGRGKKKAEVEDTTPVKRAPGRPPQKKTVEATATTSGKRGRESGSTGKDNKQPKKRSRR